jgi:hypothetical protein
MSEIYMIRLWEDEREGARVEGESSLNKDGDAD